MKKYGFDMPKQLRNTFLRDLEDNWYLPLLAKHRGIELSNIKRSNFGQYDMAVNYLTSVLEEAAAVNKVAVYNIDHMAQVRFWGKDSAALLDRTLAGNMSQMKIGSCKYTLLLNSNGGVEDDMIVMRASDEEFIMVINAGHDITDTLEDGTQKVADIDQIMRHKTDDEEVFAQDISDELVKVDIQGPFSFKVIKQVFGEQVLKNRNNPEKNMSFFTFNDLNIDGHRYFFSRTGYTNRWGWECYLPKAKAAEHFKQIVSLALELGGLLVGLGGRDENRTSAGPVGLPLMGSEYDAKHTPINAPLFDAAVDMQKEAFTGKDALAAELSSKPSKGLMILVSEGIATGRRVYLDGQRLGRVSSSINSPNLSLNQRLTLSSNRKNVNDPQGTAAIGLAWLYRIPELKEGFDQNDEVGPRIAVELYREDASGQPSGSPLKGYLSAQGISPATAPKALKNIENL